MYEKKNVWVNGQGINNMHYADGLHLLANNLKDLGHLIENINIQTNNYGLTLNLKKTKLMVVSEK